MHMRQAQGMMTWRILCLGTLKYRTSTAWVTWVINGSTTNDEWFRHGPDFLGPNAPVYHESQHRQPAQAPAMPRSFCVKFKRTQRNFVFGPQISRDLKIGTYVKVEADRGEDLGIVVGRAADKYNFPPPGRANFSAAMAPPGSPEQALPTKRSSVLLRMMKFRYLA
jgi:hypothetical protein